MHLLTFFHIHDFTDKHKKLGELCSISGKNCVGDLVCKKMEDGCDNGVGKCQPNGGEKFSFSISFWMRIIKIQYQVCLELLNCIPFIF